MERRTFIKSATLATAATAASDNNYGGAVKALNEVRKKLAEMVTAKDVPPYMFHKNSLINNPDLGFISLTSIWLKSWELVLFCIR